MDSSDRGNAALQSSNFHRLARRMGGMAGTGRLLLFRRALIVDRATRSAPTRCAWRCSGANAHMA
jgi:hypothetical protein